MYASGSSMKAAISTELLLLCVICFWYNNDPLQIRRGSVSEDNTTWEYLTINIIIEKLNRIWSGSLLYQKHMTHNRRSSVEIAAFIDDPEAYIVEEAPIIVTEEFDYDSDALVEGTTPETPKSKVAAQTPKAFDRTRTTYLDLIKRPSYLAKDQREEDSDYSEDEEDLGQQPPQYSVVGSHLPKRKHESYVPPREALYLSSTYKGSAFQQEKVEAQSDWVHVQPQQT
eukprot:TRINITY_DN4209_c0_g1_i1.p2 TRINITY_DN4209_c0_g1~~TRINITY_DN4209_c0_g1_i1.p2  ORF type:complete len:227 (-),score=34.57 TRINITY_DN4209_c0_g1_i1:129-809(-)